MAEFVWHCLTLDTNTTFSQSRIEMNEKYSIIYRQAPEESDITARTEYQINVSVGREIINFFLEQLQIRYSWKFKMYRQTSASAAEKRCIFHERSPKTYVIMSLFGVVFFS